MTAAQNVKSVLPPDTGLRIGVARVDAGGVVTVEVVGREITCGYLDPSGYVDGVPVALLRGQATWLCLGAIVDQPPPAAVTATVPVVE